MKNFGHWPMSNHDAVIHHKIILITEGIVLFIFWGREGILSTRKNVPVNCHVFRHLVISISGFADVGNKYFVSIQNPSSPWPHLPTPTPPTPKYQMVGPLITHRSIDRESSTPMSCIGKWWNGNTQTVYTDEHRLMLAKSEHGLTVSTGYA